MVRDWSNARRVQAGRPAQVRSQDLGITARPGRRIRRTLRSTDSIHRPLAYRRSRSPCWRWGALERTPRRRALVRTSNADDTTGRTIVRRRHDESHDRAKETRRRARSCRGDPTRAVCRPPRCVLVAYRSGDRLYRCMSSTPCTSTASPQRRTDEAARPLLVTVRRAAEILSLSRSSIYVLIDAGKLTPIRIGRSVRFSLEHLEGFVDDLTADG